MSINLSDLTSPNNQDVLAEITSGADFLDPIGKLENLSRGSNKGGHALQTVALNQPKALPLIKNPQGNLGGYLYIPDVSGNSATGPSVTIGSNQTWEAEVDMVITQYGNYIKPLGGGAWTSGFSLLIYSDGRARVFSKSDVSNLSAVGAIPLNTPFNVKYGFNGSALYVELNAQSLLTTSTGSNQANSLTEDLKLQAQPSSLGSEGNYAIQKAKLTVNNAVVFDCDFNGSTSIRHGDTKFNCVGGPVVLTKAGNDPITVVKKSVLRFSDAANTGLQGLLNQTIDSGYMFAAYSVLGDGGDESGRLFEVSSDDAASTATSGLFVGRVGSQNNVAWYNNGWNVVHDGLFDDANSDILHEFKFVSGSQISKINNADEDTRSLSTTISAEEFAIGTQESGTTSVAIDLEFLALFDADSVPDEATASKIRDYINKRNQIYLRHQTDGYFFFDPQKLSAGDVTSWNGNITGSDLGDTDVATNVTIVQGSQTSQPNADGYSLTFEDNTQHLEWASAYTPNFPTGQTKAWQIVGTSLGTFAYLTQGAVTELNLLGNLGNASYRQAGDLYGIILLPESATGADIEAARQLLIDRGAADGVSVTSLNSHFRVRRDIVEFGFVDTSGVTNFSYVWPQCSSMLSFPSIDTSNGTNFSQAWIQCGLQSFPALDMRNGTYFSYAWYNCSSLTSFPAGAKLGTSAQNVNFWSAWQSSGLTSFSTPLPTATSLDSAFRYCTSLVSFTLDELPLVTSVSTTWQNTRFQSFSTKLPKIQFAYAAWYYNTELTDFSADVFANWNPSGITSGVFNLAWTGCSALSADSVGNILQSIDASNQHGTDDGTSTGNPLGDSGIDIDYNVATGSLSAATYSAIDSLKAKGWSIFINSVEQ